MRGSSCAAESMCAAGHARRSLRRSLYPACGDEFFLYEKMGRRAIDHEGSNSEAGAEIQHPITPKRRESKGTRPLGRRLAGSRPAALTLGQRPRGLPPPGGRFEEPFAYTFLRACSKSPGAAPERRFFRTDGVKNARNPQRIPPLFSLLCKKIPFHSPHPEILNRL